MPASDSDTVPTLREAFGQFKRLVFLIRPYWRQLTKGFLLGPLVGILAMVPPYISKLLIDEVYPSQDVSLMHVLVGGILAVMAARAIMGAIQGYYTLYVNARLSNATRLLFFNHLQHLKPEFFDHHEVGEINSRFQDIKKALDSVNQTFSTLFTEGVYLLIVPPFLFYLQWKLALVALITIPLAVILVALAGQYLREYWKKSAEAYADLNALQIETLSQIQTVKTMALEHEVYEEANDQIDHAMQMQLKAGGMSQMLSMGNGVLRALNTALFTWLGWTFILSGQMTLGSYIAFTSYIQYLYRPLRKLVQLFSDFQESAINLRRMFRYLEKPTEQDPSTAYTSPDDITTLIEGHIQLNDVSFGYTETEMVLEDVNLDIPKGETLGLVGATGSGKTSILRLLTQMGEPDRGAVRFDGREASRIGLHDLRRQLAVVWQEYSLLEGTIWSNLTIGLDDPTIAEVDRAVELCCVDDLITDSPNGYDTEVAEWGTTLSGGQQQRLALARAVLQDAPVYLLDEVTSNLDVQTEERVLDNLFAELSDRTVVFVTHRITSATRADRICVLDSGRVVDVGTHERLMETCELYRDLYGTSAGTAEGSGEAVVQGMN
jgi:ABC-type bacteriocin/lantibiotic exporter with double-glycine peptidase domain